jgi:hypothetical protein
MRFLLKEIKKRNKCNFIRILTFFRAVKIYVFVFRIIVRLSWYQAYFGSCYPDLRPCHVTPKSYAQELILVHHKNYTDSNGKYV